MARVSAVYVVARMDLICAIARSQLGTAGLWYAPGGAKAYASSQSPFKPWT